MFGRRNFLSGLITGSLIGAVVAMFARPQRGGGAAQRAGEEGRGGLLEGPRDIMMRVSRGVTGIVRRRERS
ncbi:MAG: hypothetical protein PWP65_1717 [Clostridia bacterium]|nr:hypothetical protein [Clostridia bacterium]